MATSAGKLISELQSFVYLQAPILARPSGCSHHLGSQALYTTHSLHGYPTTGCGIATYVIWAIHKTGLSPVRLQPCRLLQAAPFQVFASLTVSERRARFCPAPVSLIFHRMEERRFHPPPSSCRRPPIFSPV